MTISHRDDTRNETALRITSKVDQGALFASGRVLLFDNANNVCAVGVMSKPAFQLPVDGIAMANNIAQDAHPTDGAIPVRFEVRDCDDVFVWRGSVGPNGDWGDNGAPLSSSQPVVFEGCFYRAAY